MTVLAQPSRVLRHESEEDRWEMVQAAPDSRLADHVLSYCSYDERTTSFVRRRELPSARVVMIVNLGEPIRVSAPGQSGWSEQAVGFVAGLHDTYALTETGGAQAGMQIDLTPVGAHLLLGIPMDELAQRVVTLEELFGADGLLLREALAEAPGWLERFALVDRFLLGLVDARTSMGWAEIARACGYYDQAHMIRDFNQFAGGPPSEFARRRLPDGGGVIGD